MVKIGLTLTEVASMVVLAGGPAHEQWVATIGADGTDAFICAADGLYTTRQSVNMVSHICNDCRLTSEEKVDLCRMVVRSTQRGE